MKNRIEIVDELFTQAKTACGATTDTETVRPGLESLVRRASYVLTDTSIWIWLLANREPYAEELERF
jgi:hypothetical protein